MIELCNLSGTAQAEHKRLHGGFNDFPPNWRELNEAEFARSEWFLWPTEVEEYRQMIYINGERTNKPAVCARLFWLHTKNGYAIVSDHSAGRVRYYAFGCVHNWGDPSAELKRRGMVLGAFQHAHHCTICGAFYITDSSD